MTVFHSDPPSDPDQPGSEVLGKLLDRLEVAGQAETVSVRDLTEAIGQESFAALMLVFALIAVSPASVVPGVTTGVAAIEFLLLCQMVAGVRQLWLPDALARLTLPGKRLRPGIVWLRRPVAFADRLLHPRLVVMTRRPWIIPWLFLALGLTVAMPFMELVPGSGTLAASCIALVAAAILTRNGVVLLLAGGCLAGMLGLLVWIGQSVL